MIQTIGLTKRFGKKTALSDLNLEISEGSVFALMGPNGAGKTTAIRTMLNIERPTAGTARVLGCDSRRLGPAQLARIGYVAEGRELPEWMRVREFFDYCAEFYPAWSRQEAANLVSMFELDVESKLGSLSRGMKMQVALAGALAYRPKLLMMDEPFSGLDVLVRERVLGCIAERTPECTVLVATHDLSDIETFATHVGYLAEGRLVFSSSMDSLRERFCEVEVLFEGAGVTPETWPLNWWNVAANGTAVRFTHADYEAARCEHEARACLPGVREVTARALPLREIFLAIARRKG